MIASKEIITQIIHCQASIFFLDSEESSVGMYCSFVKFHTLIIVIFRQINMIFSRKWKVFSNVRDLF